MSFITNQCNVIFILVSFASLLGSLKICFDFKRDGNKEYVDYVKKYVKYVGFAPKQANDEIYSINAEIYAIKPLIAFLCKPSGELIQDVNSSLKTGKDTNNFKIESRSADPNQTDNYQGKLCQLHYNQPEDIWTQKRFDPALMTRECGNKDRVLPVLGNMLVAQGLMHTLPSNKKRKYRLSLLDIKGVTPVETAEFEIYEIVKGVRWSQPKDGDFSAGEGLMANTPFDMELEIISNEDKVVTKGIGATLMVHVTLSSEYKYFFHNGPKADFLTGCMAELGKGNVTDDDDYVKISKRNHDRVLHKRAKDGKVAFKNVRILDTTKGTTRSFRFNATLLVPGGIWARVPYDYKDTNTCIEIHKYSLIKSYINNMDKDVDDVSEKMVLRNKKTTASQKIGNAQSPNFELDPDTLVYRFKPDPKCFAASAAVTLSKPFAVAAQEVDKLVILSDAWEKIVNKTFVANYPIEGIIVELKDKNGSRIYSGEHSSTKVVVTTNPATVPLSNDGKEVTLVHGRGEFTGSIIKPHAGLLKICFSILVGTSPNTPVCTDDFNVTGDIPIAVFAMLSSSGSSSDPDPLIMTYAQFAVEHINEKLAEAYPKGESANIHEQVPIFPDNRKFTIKGYDTKSDLISTMISYKKLMKDSQKYPAQKPQAIIGFSSDDLTASMYPLTVKDKVTLISVREITKQHDDMGYFIRLNWDEGSLYTCLARMFANRKWNKIALLRSSTSEVSPVFYKAMRDAKVEVLVDISFPQYPEANWTSYLEQQFRFKMKQIQLSGTKIIFSNIRAPIQYYVFRLAYKYEVSGMHGYQWISIEIPALEFPVRNHHPHCSEMRPWCSEIMVGMLLLISAHELNYESDLWQLVHWKYFEADPTIYRGIQQASPAHLVSQYARAYDAVLGYAHAILQVIQKRETVKLEDIANHIKKLSFQGLTGEVRFDSTGARAGRYEFIGALLSIRANPAAHNTDSSYTEQLCRYVYYDANIADKRNSVIEVLHEANFQTKSEKTPSEVGIMTLPVTTRRNTRTYLSKLGMISYDSVTTVLMEKDAIQQIDLPKKKWKREASKQSSPEYLIYRNEEVIQTFYCLKGCGRNNSDPNEQNMYENGICTDQDVCRCKSVKEAFPDQPGLADVENNNAYSGAYCEQVVCAEGCSHGKCVGPDLCKCDKGYTGATCADFDCGIGCGVGKCIKNGMCECQAAYAGSRCQIILPLLIAPIIGLFLLLSCCFGGIFLQWRVRQKWKEMITSTDWLVRWSDVHSDEATVSLLSASTTAPTVVIRGKEVKQPKFTEPIKTIVTWKNQKCYAEIFDAESLSMSNPVVQMEMLQLLHLRHPNLAVFVGACLDAPTVAILTEYYPKGSLEDVLPSRKLPLDWDVKFSILKDIARGMDYIHCSPIESHGRLKSSNCLMDNRWSIRVTGFGAPLLRGERKQGERGEYNPNFFLWTAPEHLRTYMTLEEIVPGTREGDVFSFAVIVSEVCSEAHPYFMERSVLSPEEIVLLLKSPDDPGNRGLKKTWISFGGSANEAIRPAIQKQQLPTEALERNGLISLMSKCWQEDPLDRPSFKEVLHLLNVMKPVRGDLVDLLIKRLEKYSTKLEEQFVEASKELQMEKMKIEELLARLLPRTIVDDMIHGKKVEAEEFDMATICFSDLADFLHLAEKATPFQIIELLNSLYIAFDSIIDNYDAYKVETVRDEYMVVSGLPVRNGHLHASEIATLALHLMSSVTNFKIAFLPANRPLMLRIGIHSGPVVAGVVGMHMPRYCLFGDTVNTASRMKTSCTALRIHMSDDTVRILKMIGGFDIELRGERDVKGRGKMITYFLNGKEDFILPMPDVKLAVSTDLQDFK